jgi:hypothetical protein
LPRRGCTATLNGSTSQEYQGRCGRRARFLFLRPSSEDALPELWWSISTG